MQSNTGFIVYLEPSKFKAGDRMSKLIRNTTRLIQGKTILQALNVPVTSLAKIIYSPEVSGALPIQVLLLRMPKITSVLFYQLPLTGSLNSIFSYNRLFSYDLKIFLRNSCKKKFFSEILQRALAFQRALNFITFRKMSIWGV